MRDAHVLWSGLEYVAGLSHYTTNEHGLSLVQHLLGATTASSTARLASRARDLHRALRGQGLTPGRYTRPLSMDGHPWPPTKI